MELDDTQKQKVGEWIEEGIKLSEIQRMLESEFGIRMTYMEVRFLIDDLKLMPKDPEAEKPEEKDAGKKAEPEPPSTEEPASEMMADPIGSGNVSITVDKITQPGSVVSGKVTFSDGNKSGWYLDQFGRLGLSPEVEGYKPSNEDLQEFQVQLQEQLKKSGF
jgi:hypothetical protein